MSSGRIIMQYKKPYLLANAQGFDSLTDKCDINKKTVRQGEVLHMEKILLVEDNENIMELNAKYLSRSGYEVLKAYTIREAEACLYDCEPDLIVLDVMLPDGDGFALCEKIRQRRNVPVLFLTAKVEDEDIIKGLSRGGDDYLTKPYDLQVFGARVKALLRRIRHELPGNQLFTVGPLSFDIVKSLAYVNETELNLTSKEYGILLCLAQHRGNPISKEALYSSVWGIDSVPSGPVLWPAVSKLKKKIAAYEEQFYIESDHSGYELVMKT